MTSLLFLQDFQAQVNPLLLLTQSMPKGKEDIWKAFLLMQGSSLVLWKSLMLTALTGFLRSETSLIQTIGRAARNAGGQVIMYADEVTGSMERAINETYRRREKQMKYNEEHDIVPQTIKKDVREILEISSKDNIQERVAKRRLSEREKNELIEKLTKEMRAAAQLLEFEHAAYLRDQIEKIRNGK